MMLIVLLPCIVTVCLGTPLQKESFRGHKVLGVEAKDASQVELLRQLEINDIELDFWSEPTLGGRTDFRVKPKDLQRIEATLNRAGLEWKIVNQDVQESIDEEARAMAAVRQSRASVSYRDTYLTFEEIISTLQNLADQYSDKVTLSTYGYSYEGRDLIQVKISKNDGIPRPAIWVESLTHAREWVTGSVALYIIEELASQSSINAKYMLDMYDWYFSPVHNPDGYVYTHTTNRMWRKNRRPISRWCTGVDLNRNWDSHFGVIGSSTNACADTYRGPNSFSEPETSAFAAAVEKIPNKVAFFSFHAYSQLLLLPYAHGQSQAPNIEVLRPMSDNAMQALNGVHGKTYRVGIPKEILYAASGGAYDYMMESVGIPYSFTYELRPDTATPGFELPPSEIMPTCEEVWASLFSYTQQIVDRK